MSQHDFDIANQTAPNSRADINLALKALASNSSGSVAPTTTYANMTYYNTANNILYKRNEADSAWITLGTVDETAGTFTPSGAVALASQAEAEAGTENTKLMTPLRVQQALQANSSGELVYVGEFLISGGVIEVTALGGYKRLIIQGADLTTSTSNKRSLRVSSTNGLSWLASSSYYNRASNNSGATEIVGHDSASSSARSPHWEFYNFGTTDPIKPVRSAASFGDEVAFVNTALALNAIQVLSDLTSGSIHIWGAS